LIAMMRGLTMVLLAVLLGSCAAPPREAPAGRPNPVVDVVNRYRADKGLPRIAVSTKLTRVAEAHVADLEAYYRKGGSCNLHSWSKHGQWRACCYTPDHRDADCMHHKPQEITGAYDSPGYEIVAHYRETRSGGGGPTEVLGITPAQALEIWQQSPAHHAMILNTRQWAEHPWRAIGAAIGTHYAVVWFGELEDPAN
jgi:hypothetical protein